MMMIKSNENQSHNRTTKREIGQMTITLIHKGKFHPKTKNILCTNSEQKKGVRLLVTKN